MHAPQNPSTPAAVHVHHVMATLSGPLFALLVKPGGSRNDR